MYISKNTQHTYYYQFNEHCDRAFMIKSDGSVHNLHGIAINKLCNCGQGVEVRVHAVEAELEKK